MILAQLLPLILLLLPSLSSAVAIPPSLYSTSLYTKLISSSSSSPSSWPEYTSTLDGTWISFPADTWTSAFFSSSFYALHQRHSTLCPSVTPTADNGSTTDWLALAREWSEGLYQVDEALTNTHDVGFLSWPAQQELNLGNTSATVKQAVLTEATHLADRFSTIVGCTESWDTDATDFEVIIDNMMNIQLLLEAALLTSNATYTTMATSHANKTIQNHVRSDYSSFHVVDYSPTTGDVLWQGTAQGYSNSSTWSRGQGWGILGFAQMYYYTSNALYLDTSRNMAQWYLTHLPSSGVAYWDFDAPAPTSYDTSSSLIVVSALLYLSSVEASNGNSTGSDYWSNSAVTLLGNVVNVGVDGWNGASLVGNGTVNNRASPPKNNTGIIYGDYYFIQAGNQLLQLGLANCSDGTPAVGSSRTALSSSSPSSSSSSGSTSSSAGRSGTGSGTQSAKGASSTTSTGGASRMRILWF